MKAVVDLREAAIPLLIAALDDPRATGTLFKGKPTPLGHMALDILTHVIKLTNTVLVEESGEDGLGACIKSCYYFRPDATPAKMGRTKKKWQELYRQGAIVFLYPKWCGESMFNQQ